MNRPYIICHMVTSIDGKVTGDFLYDVSCQKASEIYYRLNRELKVDGFICGRITMETSFTKGWYPDLSQYDKEAQNIDQTQDFINTDNKKRKAIAFDTYGKLGWKESKIKDPDGDIGYDGAEIIEVLSSKVDNRYLAYLQSLGISYIMAGQESIDVTLALEKLAKLFDIHALLLEGGSVLNGSFAKAHVIDELSLVVAPITARAEDKSLFFDGNNESFKLANVGKEDNVVILNYKRSGD